MAAAALPVVCVTGGAGFVAGWLVARLLENGYTVRATVRKTKQAAYLTELPGADRLSVHEVDLLDPAHKWVPIVEGCSVVFHTASPFSLDGSNPDTLLRPAIDGCLHVLEACSKSRSVKRVVHTSSFITIFGAHDYSTPFTEADHNTRASLAKGQAYAVSKVESEKACWQFMKAQRRSFDLVTIHPPMVLGPFLPGYSRRPSESSMMIALLLSGKLALPAGRGMAVVDVRDVALAHVRAMNEPKANGRYLVSGGTLSYPEIATLLATRFPSCPVQSVSHDETLRPRMPVIDASKSVRELGMVYRSPIETVRDQADAMVHFALSRL